MYRKNPNSKNDKTYLEDYFDLDEYKASKEKQHFDNRYNKGKKAINLVTLMIGVFCVVLVFLFSQLVGYYLDLYKNEKINKESQAVLGDIVAPTGNQPLFLTERKDDSIIIKNGDSHLEENPDENNEVDTPAIKTILPEVIKLRETLGNDDIVGHVRVQGTNINYTIAQSTDNDFYLTKDLNKQENAAGSIYMDSDAKVDPLSDNIILYGHNMKDGSMFHNIRYYSDYEYFTTNKYINLMTLYENTQWEIFAFYDTHTDFDYLITDFDSEERHQEFLNEITSRSNHLSPITVTTEDKILTLSTCTNVDENTRFVVHAKLISR